MPTSRTRPLAGSLASLLAMVGSLAASAPSDVAPGKAPAASLLARPSIVGTARPAPIPTCFDARVVRLRSPLVLRVGEDFRCIKAPRTALRK